MTFWYEFSRIGFWNNYAYQDLCTATTLYRVDLKMLYKRMNFVYRLNKSLYAANRFGQKVSNGITIKLLSFIFIRSFSSRVYWESCCLNICFTRNKRSTYSEAENRQLYWKLWTPPYVFSWEHPSEGLKQWNNNLKVIYSIGILINFLKSHRIYTCHEVLSFLKRQISACTFSKRRSITKVFLWFFQTFLEQINKPC